MLELENKILRQQIEVRQAEIDYNESQASVARGCDLWRAVCPDSMVARGRTALADGYSGSGRWFWLAFILKLVAIGAAPAAFLGVAAWSWFRFAKPEADKAEAARMIAASAQAEAEKAKQAATQARQDIQNTALRLAAERKNLAELQHQTKLARDELKITKQAIDALSSFS
jgi:hypothetical protein